MALIKQVRTVVIHAYCTVSLRDRRLSSGMMVVPQDCFEKQVPLELYCECAHYHLRILMIWKY